MIFKKIRELLAEQFGVEAEGITRATSFEEDLGADSLDIVELTLMLEEEFDLGEIEDDALSNLKTVGDVVALIAARVPEADD